MTTYIAIPARYASVKLHIDKGRKWSVVEHLLLFSISDSAQSAAQLVEETKLPWRLIVEVMSRLMRVGWVDLISGKSGIQFQITSFGKSVVSNDILPAITTPQIKSVSFVIERISGAVLRVKGLNIFSETRLARLRQDSNVIELPAERNVDNSNPADIISALLEEDEHPKGIETIASRLIDKYIVVSLNDGNLDGLPHKASGALKSKIFSAAATSSEKYSTESKASDGALLQSESFGKHEIYLDRRCFVIGGKAHKESLEKTLRRSKTWIVVHSTFIYAEKFEIFYPLIRDAALRGVRIDVLWGKSTDPDGSNIMLSEIEKCEEMLEDDVLRERVRLHRFTTDSHAKLLCADDGQGNMVAIVGSCNWLCANFKSLDVSISFKDPKIVADIFSRLASMTMSSSGCWSDLTCDLATQSVDLKERNRLAGHQPNAKAILVLGDEHNRFMQEARDEAKHEIIIASHRLSSKAETLVMSPMKAALKNRNVDIKLYFGQSSNGEERKVTDKLVQNSRDDGIKIKKIRHPRLHAKFLAWDDDNIVITSQNWMSSDPMGSSCSEIGVCITRKGIARELIEMVESELNLAGDDVIS